MPRPTPRWWIYLSIVGLAIVAIAFYFLTRDATQVAETRTDERNAAVGAAEGVIDCVVDPDTETTDECEDEAQDAQETLEEQVPPVGLTQRQRREVILIAAELIAAEPELSEADVVTAVLDRIPQPEDGARGRPGPRGPAGQDADPPTTEEIRALVVAVYNANPPAPGADGRDGEDGRDSTVPGPRGDTGPAGKDATPEMVAGAVDRYCSARGECAGPQGSAGPPGPQGDPGAPGSPGRGITAIACDSVTPFTLTVTYSDGTTATYECSRGVTAE